MLIIGLYTVNVNMRVSPKNALVPSFKYVNY